MSGRAYTITTYGCREWLRRKGYIVEGELLSIPVKGPRHILIAEIQAAVAEHFFLPVAEMKSARRGREIARPRQVAMYLSKQLTPRSLPEIGRRFGGRDHTTVIHAIRQITKMRESDAELDAHVVALENEISNPEAARG